MFYHLSKLARRPTSVPLRSAHPRSQPRLRPRRREANSLRTRFNPIATIPRSGLRVRAIQGDSKIAVAAIFRRNDHRTRPPDASLIKRGVIDPSIALDDQKAKVCGLHRQVG